MAESEPVRTHLSLSCVESRSDTHDVELRGSGAAVRYWQAAGRVLAGCWLLGRLAGGRCSSDAAEMRVTVRSPQDALSDKYWEVLQEFCKLTTMRGNQPQYLEPTKFIQRVSQVAVY